MQTFFEFDWGKQGWNLIVALSAMFGGCVAANNFGGDGLAHISHSFRYALPNVTRALFNRRKCSYCSWEKYRLTNIYAKVKKLDEWLRNRLRYCIWHDWKKPERKHKNLIQLGIENRQAYAWSRTRMGGWAVAQSPILRTTITKSRLKRKGYKFLVDYINKTQTSIW